MKSRLLLAACALVALSLHAPAAELPMAKPESVGMSSERLARVGESLQRHIAAGDITGAVTAIARRGKLVQLQAYGLFDVDAKSPMRTDTIFRMASNSKPITAVAILMMAEEGKLRLSDPVSMYIPEFRKLRVAVPRASRPAFPAPAAGAKPEVDLIAPNREITLQDLLTHTAGLVTFTAVPGLEIPRKPEETLADYIPRVGDGVLDFQPGSKWSYSPSVGFETLGRILEIVSGQTLDVFLRERLFKPLGMNSTAFALSPQQKPRLVPMYRKGPDGKWALAPPAYTAVFLSDTYFSGGAGLMSTAQDYLSFELLRLNGGELNGKRLLSPKSLQLMGMNQVGDLYRGFRGDESGSVFGLGVAVATDEAQAQPRRSAGSSGWSGAYGTISWIDPRENLAAVLLMQQSNRLVQVDFANAVMQAIVQSDAPR